MTGHVNPDYPGEGLFIADGGDPQPVQAPYLDDATVAALGSGPLIGGEPGAGKTGLRNLAAVRAALDGGGHADAGS